MSISTSPGATARASVTAASPESASATTSKPAVTPTTVRATARNGALIVDDQHGDGIGVQRGCPPQAAF